MNVITVSTSREFEDLVSNIKMYSNSNTRIHITGSLYPDLSRTYVAFGKCSVQKTAGGIGAVTGLVGGVLATIFTAGAALPALLAGSALTYAGGSAAMVLAVKEFRASAYADEVYTLSQHGFELIENKPPVIVIG